MGEVYEDYASKQQKYPRPHTDDVDPQRYMYRVETPPPTQTYTSAGRRGRLAVGLASEIRKNGLFSATIRSERFDTPPVQ